jgi:uncharacterized protein (UPF0147 family)
MSEEDDVSKTILEIIKKMEFLINDTSVPKNVRSAISEAKRHLESGENNIVKISSAIYSIDSISNDINLPPQARSGVWGLLSALESIKTSS